jgi:hypothetical protein
VEFSGFRAVDQRYIPDLYAKLNNIKIKFNWNNLGLKPLSPKSFGSRSLSSRSLADSSSISPKLELESNTKIIDKYLCNNTSEYILVSLEDGIRTPREISNISSK